MQTTYEHYRDKKKLQKSDERRQSAQHDPETGFALKAAESTAEEDCKAVNPGWGIHGLGYKTNCMYCTTAFELRRRGYDVTAGKMDHDGEYSEVIKEWFPNSKKPTPIGDAYDDSPYDAIADAKERMKALVLRGKGVRDAARETLFKEPEGSRGNLMIDWTTGSGHSVAYVIENGKPVLYESQVGEVVKNVDKYLSRAVYAEYVRLDNCEFDKTKIKGVVK